MSHGDVIISSDEAESVMQSGLYLPEGKYSYINNNTFFKVVEISPANKAGRVNQTSEVP